MRHVYVTPCIRNAVRRLGVISLTATGAVVLLPAVALAHGIGGRLDLPVPVTYFVVGAGVVLVVSFVALAVLWPEPRLQDGPPHDPSRFPLPRGWMLPATGVVSLLLVIGQLLPPLLGLETDPTRPTIAPVLVWVVFWLVVPFAGAVVGDWYTDINPWRSLGRVLRIGQGERVGLSERLGVWPAAFLLVAFTWLELVSPDSGSPVVLGTAALVYTLLTLGLMAYAGRETGLAVFDAFTPYNRLISSISPLGRRDGRLVWRGWLRALTVIPPWRGVPAFVVIAIGTVTYDGASATESFRGLMGDVGQTMLGETVLLIGCVLAIGAAYWLASWVAARMVGGDWTAVRVATRFAHTLVPIALAYAVAHYMTLIVFEGQQLITAVSDPFALGWDLFGTAERKIDFFLTASEPVWYAQVAVIVTGHVLGVVLAHDRALGDFGTEAVRSQYAMLLLMVALTTLGLLILSG
ncbi:MAG: fenitrothion hydrolase [Acidimicrobiia bacterium]